MIMLSERRWAHGDNMAKRYSYLRDPAAIYRASQTAVEQATDLSGIPEDMRDIAIRLVHSCGMPEIIKQLVYSADAATAGRRALQAGAKIFTDSRMVLDGIIRNRLPRRNPVICTINEGMVAETARRQRITRAAAAVDMWQPYLTEAIVVIGNAPTALYRILELLSDGAPRPALIIGMPVGFVGAAEAKEQLVADAGRIPYITLRGRAGGSALAAAALNALCGGLAGEEVTD
jgi:precorrin-8X/cobalt-precorrin-8 methylmutase